MVSRKEENLHIPERVHVLSCPVLCIHIARRISDLSHFSFYIGVRREAQCLNLARVVQSSSCSEARHLTTSHRALYLHLKVHHVLKDHPYRKLALSLRRSSIPSSSTSSSREHPRVVGLTASYSYAVGDAKTRASLTRMCRELGITNTETATLEELKACGYHATGASAEVSLAPPSLRPPSTSTYTFAATTVPRGVVPEADRKPHLMGPTFFSREARGTCTAFSRLLMVCVRSMEDAIVAQRSSPFASPLPPSGTLAPREWGGYVHKLANGGGGGGGGGRGCSSGTARKCVRCGIPEGAASRGGGHNGSTARPLLAELEHWYEAVKTLVVTWEEGEDEAATILDMFGCVGSPSYRKLEQRQRQQGDYWPAHVLQNISSFWQKVPGKFPRYEQLKEKLLEKYEHHGGDGRSSGGKAFRGIVFVRQRVTTHALAHVIGSDARLAPLFSTACLYASSSPATASLSVTKSQAQASIRAFRSGKVNLLLATVVAEEGMDIPAANCVIRYDAMVHAVSLVQGRGRAREEDSSFVVLRERSDRTTADLEAVERQQLQLVKKFKPPAAGSAAAAAADAALVAAQRSRERGARAGLLASAVAADAGGVLGALNLFCKKTKVVLEESWSKGAGGLWVCTLSYESPLRELHAAASAEGKKPAKKLAAAKLLADLRAAVPA